MWMREGGVSSECIHLIEHKVLHYIHNRLTGKFVITTSQEKQQSTASVSIIRGALCRLSTRWHSSLSLLKPYFAVLAAQRLVWSKYDWSHRSS